MTANDTTSSLRILDTRVAPVFAGASLRRLCTGAIWSEGPIWLSQDQSVLWSDIPNNRILRWSAASGMSVWREQVEFTNGHALDREGNLLHCSHGLRAIVRTPQVQGVIRADTIDEVLVREFQGKRLNSPNDVVVQSNGCIWFTDPPYGILSDREGHQGRREQPHNHVFCYDPAAGTLHAASDFMQEPNGLAFSPDEQLLYVSDTSAALSADGTGHHHIVVFDVKGHTLQNPRVFAEISPGLPDGFRVDHCGWIYTSSLDSVQVYHPDGTLLGKILVPEKVGNLTFGGVRGDTLFIAASTSLYSIVLNTRGAIRP
ncbi:SMP-30/gluconolactonase/LRE family protein [Acidovorax sp. LjRoot117]|uniref:SMP-30/gluconolactonase/LRE family protein n=1 Tax=Acidovorax sp. LjRoot117 TaxID=3342255 RepID=UPI003ECE65E3